MNIFSRFFSAFEPQTPVPVCVLPMPRIEVKREKVTKPHDAFLEREETNTWGFNTATAIMRSEGSVAHLTAYDVQELKARDIWASEKTTRGRVANAVKGRAKKEWHDGLSSIQIAGVLNVSESWAEKHCAAFAAALAAEKGE